MTSDQLLDKVKKLLALAASPNENEASLAGKRAKEIIAKYCLDLKNENKVEDIVELPFVFPNAPPSLRKYLSLIALKVAEPYGVHILLTNRGQDICLVGFSTNTKVAEHAITCILNWGLSDYRSLYRTYRTITFGNGFWDGFYQAIKKRFATEQEINENAMIIYDPVKRYMEKFTHTNIGLTYQGFGIGVSEGQASGANAQINPGVNQNVGFGGYLK